MAKINAFHTTLFAQYSEDSCARRPTAMVRCSITWCMLYGCGMSDSNAHSPVNVPVLVLGGGSAR